MSTRIETHKQQLADARASLNAIFDQVGDRWETTVYEDGLAWNARQIAVHLADADRGHTLQVMRCAEGHEVVPTDFDLERYNRRQTEKRANVTVEEARAALVTNRADLLRWPDTMADNVLDRTGRNAFLHIWPLWRFLDHMAAHERHHATDIACALSIPT